MPSVKKNFGYNLLLTLCGYIFPLITYPYVSRVLGVQNIGICNFADSVINYFVLFSMLGIGSFGVREIARVREDMVKTNSVFSNLISVNFITSIFAVIILITCTFTVPKFADYKPYLLIGVIKLIFNMFLIEWFFQGIQDFKYITIRSLIIKVLYVISIFVFVHDAEDVILYYFLTAFATIINAIINWIYARNFVKLSLRGLDIKVFIVPILTFGYYRILTSMYTTFNIVFLGFSSGDIEVGYFATATKLYIIIMSVLSAFTTVMVPKVSELMHAGQTRELQWIADQSLSIIAIFSIPIIIYSQFCAGDIISLIAGPGYEGAIVPFRVVIFMLLIIGAEQILIQQFLMASTNSKPIFIVSTFGAVTGIGLNVLITPLFGSVGASIAWSISEVVVLISGIVFVRKEIGVKVSFRELLENILWSLLYLLPMYGVCVFHLGLYWNLIVSGIVMTIVFVVINLWFNKNQQLLCVLHGFKQLFAK